MEHSFNKKFLAEQGLKYCDVCKQAEIELEKECPGNSIRVGAEVSDDFGGNKQLRDTLTIIYQLAQKGKTLGWEFDRKTKGVYNFNIKLDVSEYDS